MPDITPIQERLPAIRDAAREMQETLLANLVMIGEISAPGGAESGRAQFLQDRFAECDLQNVSTDEATNVAGILPGEGGRESCILLTAHLDDNFDEKIDRNISVQPGGICGPGVGDDALGLATLATLPTLLERLDLSLRSDLVLLGDSRSLGQGDLAGLRFFMNHTQLPVGTALCLEGTPLGRLSHATLGMLRGRITVSLPEAYDWTKFGATSAVATLNEIINRIQEIPLPKRPRTSIVLGSVRAGDSFNIIATHGTLRFEIRSETDEIVGDIHQRIESACQELSAAIGAEVTFQVVSRRRPGGLPFTHPLVRRGREILAALGAEPRLLPSTSGLTVFIERNIPALTLGLTGGEHLGELDETLSIEPMFTGLAQLVGLLLAIDGGLTDEA